MRSAGQADASRAERFDETTLLIGPIFNPFQGSSSNVFGHFCPSISTYTFTGILLKFLREKENSEATKFYRRLFPQNHCSGSKRFLKSDKMQSERVPYQAFDERTPLIGPIFNPF